MKVSLVRHTSVELDGNFTCYGALDVEVNPTFEQEAKGAKGRLRRQEAFFLISCFRETLSL